MRRRGFARAAALLLGALGLLASPALLPAQDTAAGAGAGTDHLPVLVLGELTLESWNGASAAQVRGALAAWWERRLAGRLGLLTGTEPRGSWPTVTAEARNDASGLLLRVTTSGQGKSIESRTRVHAATLDALVPALAGEMLAGWARLVGYPAPEVPPPRLAALLELSALSTPAGGLGPSSEPLDCAAGPAGPVVLFSDRTLSLGRRLELIPESLRDLILRPPLPQGLIPSHLAVDPWGEALVYGEGAVVRYDPESLSPRRTALPALGAQDFAGPAGGGFVALASGRIVFGARQDERLVTAELPSPAPFQVAVAADPRGGVWLYDLAERKIRVFAVPDAGGGSGGWEETGSITPLVSPEELPVPQVMEVFTDGGFLLGGSGRLWRFDRTGWPLWLLEDFGAGVRQSLPAFYRVALDGDRAFYLLDPLSGRLLRFVDLEEGPEAAASAGGALRFPGPPEPVDLELAGLFRRWTEASTLGATAGSSPQDRAREELVEACLQRGFLLMACSVDGGVDLSRQLRERRAELLSELGRQYEERLVLPGAEEAWNAALRALRGLRAEDPVDARYPEQIRELERRRNDVREILVAEPALELLPPRVGNPGRGDGDGDEGRSGPTGGVATDAVRPLELRLRNRSGGPLQDLRFQVRVPGLPAGTLTAALHRLAARGTATLTASLPTGGGVAAVPLREDLSTRVLVLVTLTAEDGERTFWLQEPLLVPADRHLLPPLGSRDQSGTEGL